MRSFRFFVAAFLLLGFTVNAAKVHLPDKPVSSTARHITDVAELQADPVFPAMDSNSWSVPEIPPEQIMEEITRIRNGMDSPIAELTWVDEDENNQLFQQSLQSQLGTSPNSLLKEDNVDGMLPTIDKPLDQSAWITISQLPADGQQTNELASELMTFSATLEAQGNHNLARRYRRLAEDLADLPLVRLASPRSSTKY